MDARMIAAAAMDLVLEAAREAKGCPLDPDEAEEVLLHLAAWIDLLARGIMSPEQLAAIVHREAAEVLVAVH